MLSRELLEKTSGRDIPYSMRNLAQSHLEALDEITSRDITIGGLVTKRDYWQKETVRLRNKLHAIRQKVRDAES